MSEDWIKVTLGDIVTMTKGSTATQKAIPGKYPLVVTAAEFLSSDHYQFEGEAVCVPMVSSTGHGHASLKRVHYASGKFAVANIVTALQKRNDAPVDMKYLHLLLDHQRDSIIVPLMKGTANVSLSQRSLAGAIVSLPPVEEQRRIVDLIGAVDDAIAKAEAAVVALGSTWRRVREAAMPATSEGVCLGDVASVQLGRMLSKERASGPDQAPYIRNANVQWGGLDMSDLKTMSFPTEDREKYRLIAGDILVCEGGDPGRAVLLREDLPGIYYQKAVHRVRARPMDPRFLFHAISEAYENGSIADLCTVTTIAHLTAEKFRRLVVPNPIPEEQTRIADLLDVHQAVAVNADHHVDRLRELRSNLLTALLSGEHVIPETYDELLEVEA